MSSRSDRSDVWRPERTTHKEVDLKIVYESSELLPKYATPLSSGFDLVSNEHTIIEPHTWKLIKTGIKVGIPLDYELQIRSRSGLALKNGISVLNSPATIDADYRLELGVILMNNSNIEFVVSPGMRIAQAVLCPIVQANFIKVEKLNETERTGGFGSTGV